MTITETILKPASIFEKELRKIHITEIQKEEFVELAFYLAHLWYPVSRHKSKFVVYIGDTRVDCWFKTREELSHFMNGFIIAMQLNDSSYSDRYDDYYINGPNRYVKMGWTEPEG